MSRRADRRRPRAQRLVIGALLLALAGGCASPVQVRRQATGEERAAYELRGPSLADLQAEGRRLCPQGLDVQRADEQFERAKEPRSGWLTRWWDRAWLALDPPQRQAQLALTCRG